MPTPQQQVAVITLGVADLAGHLGAVRLGPDRRAGRERPVGTGRAPGWASTTTRWTVLDPTSSTPSRTLRPYRPTRFRMRAPLPHAPHLRRLVACQ